MGGNDNKSPDRSCDSIQAGARKTKAEHQTDKVEQERPANTDDDGLNYAVMRKARAF